MKDTPVKLTQDELGSFASAELETYALSGMEIDRVQAHQSLMRDIEGEFIDLNSPETRLARLAHFCIPGTKEEDFEERIVELGSGRKIIFGVRHISAKAEFPFVQLRANFPIGESEALPLYHVHLSRYFEVFSPLYVRVPTPLPPKTGIVRSVHLVASAADILKSDPWPEEKIFSLQEVSDFEFYDWYASGYRRFHRTSPKLRDFVTVNSPAVMRKSVESGLLSLVIVQGETVGLIAADRSPFLGHPALYFNEIFIDGAWKGRGLAKAVQRKFISRSCSAADWVWGTVDQKNLPSYKTALSNGRKAIRYESFLPIS
jgi:hypothetical protein